ncbi:hypothetical protein [Nocardiopsis aegyptia]|uniref:Uncharacterized protein n=1 Tax=Nocardiopsis aegyptia TaxID=220378 RepID=A0A7Z0EKZ0_9ACTN|nr:hypothetical protein [Nocardiopsis aegyptia]NYJ33789.1 hypothetical protein [Nocardiopsis aegyptia]
MPGYALYPSHEMERLRTEFPDHLICELHDDTGRPVFTATLRRRRCACPTALVIAGTPAVLRRSLTGPEQEAR